MSLRNYTNTATESTLVGSIGSSDVSWNLNSFAGYPAVPFTAAIERGTASEEIVLITAVSSSTVTATRGYNGTTAKAHPAGAGFLHVVVAADYTESNAHVNATTGVHGVLGALVGTTDTQTLTNKTLVSALIASPAISGTATMASATLTGTLSVTGAASLTTATFSAGLALAQIAAPTGVAGKDTIWAQSDGGLYVAQGTTTGGRLPVHWGSGTVFPTGGILAGDLYLHSGVGCTFRYTGSAWRQADPCVVASATNRTALSTNYATALHLGFQVHETDTAYHYVYAGSGNWRLVAGATPYATGGLVRASDGTLTYAAAGDTPLKTTGTQTGWTAFTASNGAVGIQHSLPGRYRVSAVVPADGNVTSTGNRWTYLKCEGTAASAFLDSVNQNDFGFGGVAGSMTLDCPTGIQVAFTFGTSGVASSLLGGSRWTVEWVKSLL